MPPNEFGLHCSSRASNSPHPAFGQQPGDCERHVLECWHYQPIDYWFSAKFQPQLKRQSGSRPAPLLVVDRISEPLISGAAKLKCPIGVAWLAFLRAVFWKNLQFAGPAFSISDP